MKRLNSLKRRFTRDSQLDWMYKTFIADMLEKGYPRRVETEGQAGYNDTYRIMAYQIQQNQEKSE